MFKSFTNIFSSLGSIFKRSGKSSSASPTGVGGTNEKKGTTEGDLGRIKATQSTHGSRYLLVISEAKT